MTTADELTVKEFLDLYDDALKYPYKDGTRGKKISGHDEFLDAFRKIFANQMDRRVDDILFFDQMLLIIDVLRTDMIKCAVNNVKTPDYRKHCRRDLEEAEKIYKNFYERIDEKLKN